MVRDLADMRELKYAECNEFNLSVSRNIGIKISSGDIVAFIDDDAYPEPEWLNQLAAAFENPQVSAAGGVTYDHTGYSFQARFIVCDRFGDAHLYHSDPGISDFNFPYRTRFPSLLGTNTAFVRSELVGIGGFDEEFDYYLDETDVCCRLVDAGKTIVEIDGAPVHHKFLPSHLRNEHRFLSTPYPVLKNKVYFSVSHSGAHHRIEDAIRNIETFFSVRRADIAWGLENGRVFGDALGEFDDQADRALRVGLARGLEGKRRTRSPEWFGQGDPFQHFATLRPASGRRTFVFLSQNYPPENPGGNARHTHDIARAIAAVGHTVHVLTAGQDFNRVDLEGGVWVHRIVPSSHKPRRLADGQVIPQRIWDYSASMLEEVIRINSFRRVDVVEGVSWDCETAAFVLDGRFPVATNIVTSLSHWLDTHPEQANDAKWMKEFGRPMLALERIVYDRSDGIVAASEAIVHDLRNHYGAILDAGSVLRCPHGLEDMRPLNSKCPSTLGEERGRRLSVLFVGRLELRKGVDTLLEAAGRLLAQRDDLEFWIVGDNSIQTGDGLTEQQRFLASATGRRAGERVRFIGSVSDSELHWLYRDCDLFVAPSRFESFGLVYVEAMMFAKPVIGCLAGGIAEVVEDGETGLLVPPGDALALSAAIAKLADDRALRDRLGQAGRRAYDTRFAAPVAAKARIEALNGLARTPLSDRSIQWEGGFRQVAIGGAGEKCGTFLEPGARATYVTSKERSFISFLSHDWSGVVEINVGNERLEHDLYSALEKEVTVRIETPAPNTRVTITRSDRKNERSRASEVIVLSVEDS